MLSSFAPVLRPALKTSKLVEVPAVIPPTSIEFSLVQDLDADSHPIGRTRQCWRPELPTAIIGGIAEQKIHGNKIGSRTRTPVSCRRDRLFLVSKPLFGYSANYVGTSQGFDPAEQQRATSASPDLPPSSCSASISARTTLVSTGAKKYKLARLVVHHK